MGLHEINVAGLIQRGPISLRSDDLFMYLW